MKKLMLLASAAALALSGAAALAQAKGSQRHRPRRARRVSIECSKQADAKGLHGKARHSFRDKCKREGARRPPSRKADATNVGGPFPKRRPLSVRQPGLSSFQERLHAFARQFVGALVLACAGVAAHPVPVTSWRLRASSSRCHSSTFLTGFLSAVFQPSLLPAVDPLADAVLHVFGVGVQIDARRASSRPPAPRWRPSAPCGCWWSPARRRTAPCGARPRSGSRPSRRGPGFPEQAPSV